MKSLIVLEKMANKIIPHILCFLYLPGLIFHELCHAIACICLGGKITNIEFVFPNKEEIVYGVNMYCENLDPLGFVIVSSAPVIGLVLMLIILPIINYWMGALFIFYVLIRGKVFFYE